MKCGVIGLTFFLITVPFLFGREVPKRILLRLSSEEFKVRETAEGELRDWAETGKRPAFRAIKSLTEISEDPEIRNRCLSVLKLISDRSYMSSGRGYLGIQLTEQRIKIAGDKKNRTVIRVLSVIDGSPANQGGLLPGDLILELNRKKWYDIGAASEFSETISAMNPLEFASLIIQRGDAELKEITICLGKRPDAVDNFRMGGNPQMMDEIAKKQYFDSWLKDLN